eukprot:354254-Chlamydomonas_euryale.AAC.3
MRCVQAALQSRVMIALSKGCLAQSDIDAVRAGCFAESGHDALRKGCLAQSDLDAAHAGWFAERRAGGRAP